MANEFEARWADQGKRAQILRLVRAVEHEPGLMEVSPHIMVIGRK